MGPTFVCGFLQYITPWFAILQMATKWPSLLMATTYMRFGKRWPVVCQMAFAFPTHSYTGNGNTRPVTSRW